MDSRVRKLKIIWIRNGFDSRVDFSSGLEVEGERNVDTRQRERSGLRLRLSARLKEWKR